MATPEIRFSSVFPLVCCCSVYHYNLFGQIVCLDKYCSLLCAATTVPPWLANDWTENP